MNAPKPAPRTPRIALPAIALLSLFALAGSGCDRTAAETAATVARPVVAQTVIATDRAATERYSGEVHARYEAPLAFRIDGKITRRAVGIGDHVKAGQLLATLDTSDASMNAASAA